jgi:hypothetical protein
MIQIIDERGPHTCYGCTEHPYSSRITTETAWLLLCRACMKRLLEELKSWERRLDEQTHSSTSTDPSVSMKDSHPTIGGSSNGESLPPTSGGNL